MCSLVTLIFLSLLITGSLLKQLIKIREFNYTKNVNYKLPNQLMFKSQWWLHKLFLIFLSLSLFLLILLVKEVFK